MQSHVIGPYLDDLERRLDEAVEERLWAEWVAFTEGRFEGDIFSPKRAAASPPGVEWPRVLVNQAIADFDRMALQQFGMCSRTLAEGTGALLNVRSNYGTSILPSLFGVRLFHQEDEQDTLPTSWPLVRNGNLDPIRRIVDAGLPDLEALDESALAGKTLLMAERFEALRAHYPKIGRFVHHYHPDLQGPMDVCEVMLGSHLFLALVDEPDLIHTFLDLLTETYIRYLRRWGRIAEKGPGGIGATHPPGLQANDSRPLFRVHWGMMHRGVIMLRDDSAMNLSPAMFDEFVRPYDQRLLDEFGGGAIHFCGRGDHFVPSMGRMPGMHAIAMGQPEYNDMEVIYAHTVDRGIALIGLRREAAEAALARGRALHGRVHCW